MSPKHYQKVMVLSRDSVLKAVHIRIYQEKFPGIMDYHQNFRCLLKEMVIFADCY